MHITPGKFIFYTILFCALFAGLIMGCTYFGIHNFEVKHPIIHKSVEEIIVYPPESRQIVFHNVPVTENGEGCVEIFLQGQSFKHCGPYEIISKEKKGK
jgi:hypothetical protein